MEVDYIPLGSWLLAKLGGLVGGEESLIKHVGVSCVLVTKQEEGVLAFDVFESQKCYRPLGVVLVCFEEHWITLRGHAPMELHEVIVEDLAAILARDAFVNLTPCAFVVGGRLLGWDGESFFGSRRRTSRFYQ